MNTMTDMEKDAHRQGQYAARCGWKNGAENPFRDDALRDAWEAGYSGSSGVTTPVAGARQECETPMLFLPS
jgi:hypothetical protein